MDCETAFMRNHQVAGAVHTVARIIPGNLMMSMISKIRSGMADLQVQMSPS
jgi:hypothetical protein